MSGFRQGKGGRGGKGRGCGSVGVQNNNSSATSSFRTNPQTSPETGQSNIPHQGQSIDSISSRIVVENSHPTLDIEDNDAGNFCKNSGIKKGRGRYKSLDVDKKTKYGDKIPIIISDDTERVVGPGSRDFVNYCGLIMRSTISLRDVDWNAVIAKYGEAMWLKVKDKFEDRDKREHVLQALVIKTMQRLFRSWKTRLHSDYSKYTTDEERLSHRPDDVMPEDWIFLVGIFGSEKFKAISERNKLNRGKQFTKHLCGSKSFAEVEEETRDPDSGNKTTPDRIWELQHTCKNNEGDKVWSDSQSQQIHELVTQRTSEENERPMNSDENLATVLGERSGYVRGKGYEKRPTKKNRVQQVDLEVSMSSAMDTMRQEMQEEMDRKMQEEREKMAADLQSKLEEQVTVELQSKLEEERAHMKLQVDKAIKDQIALWMITIQKQGQNTSKMRK